MKELCKTTMVISYERISFYGDKRGEQDYNYFSEMLKNDLEELGENTGNYKEKFIDKVMNIYYKQSNCTSSFIVGPANYNLKRHEKAWASRDKAESDFYFWRKKYFKAVNRVRTLSPEAELDALALEIPRLELKKERMKSFNKEIKKGNQETAAEIIKEIWPDIEAGPLSEILENGPFQSWQVSSITTKIRERKKKVEVMKARIEAKNNQKTVYFPGGSIYIENDRVIISHDEKPDRSIIDEIKKNGFRWSPKCKNWCRKHTANARHSANFLLKNVLGGEIKKGA